MTGQRKKIGIMGGAFDPIHYGHLLIAENAAAQYDLDEVVFMPTGISPHKEKQHITDSVHRCEMTRLAIADNPRFSLSTLEIQTAGTDYTYRTLEKLKELYPDKELYFIMGGDSLREFEKWRNPDRILKAANLLAAIRDNVEGEAFQEQMNHLKRLFQTDGIYSLSTPNFTVSSRKIRSLVRQGQTIRYMVPEPVRIYILEHGLYQEGVTEDEST